MASLILRAAARISRSAASAAYRFAAAAAAAAARSDSGGAAASDPLKHSSSVAAAGTTRSPASSGRVHTPVAAGPPQSRLSRDLLEAIMHGVPFVKPDWAKFEANEKDLESDDALWDLYERWCKFFDQERDREEMARRFSYFKQTVLRVEENKKKCVPPYSPEINKFADGKLSEPYRKWNPAANKGPVRRNRRN